IGDEAGGRRSDVFVDLENLLDRRRFDEPRSDLLVGHQDDAVLELQAHGGVAPRDRHASVFHLEQAAVGAEDRNRAVVRHLARLHMINLGPPAPLRVGTAVDHRLGTRCIDTAGGACSRSAMGEKWKKVRVKRGGGQRTSSTSADVLTRPVYTSLPRSDFDLTPVITRSTRTVFCRSSSTEQPQMIRACGLIFW